MMKKLGRLFSEPLLLSLLVIKLVDASDVAIYEGKIKVDICGDSPNSHGLSFTLKTLFEDALVNFHRSIHQHDGFKVLSVKIRDDKFIQGSECPDSEDDQIRRRLRGAFRSSLYYILGGQCYGACPDDPTDRISTINRGRRKNSVQNSKFLETMKLQKKNEALKLELKKVFPKLEHASFQMTGKKINCSSALSCRSNNGECCGVGDCTCRKDQLFLCDSLGFNCKQTDFPNCLNDLSCGKFIAMSVNQQTLAIGSGFLGSTPFIQVYDKQNNGKWHQRGKDIFEPNLIENFKNGDRFDYSVHISNSTKRLSVGYGDDTYVSIFDWNPDSTSWKHVNDQGDESKHFLF